MTPRDVFERAHQQVRAYDPGYVEWFAEDGVLSFPFAPPGVPRRLEGRQAIWDFLAPRYDAARAAGRTLAYRDLRVHETADLEVIVVEFEATSVNADGTTHPPLAFVQVVTVRDDHIVEQRDYFDSLAMVSRLG